MSTRLTHGVRSRGVVFIGSIIALTVTSFAQQLPDTLQHAIASRTAIKTVDIEWSVVREAGALAGIERYYRTRVAKNCDRLEIQLGDFEGRLPVARGGRLDFVDAGHRRVLIHEDGSATDFSIGDPYFTELDKSHADETFSSEYRADIRALGMGLRYRSEDGLNEAIWSGVDKNYTGEPIRYREERKGDLIAVTADFKTKQRLVWSVNPDRDWSIERIVFIDSDNAAALETIVNLKQFGKVWFPESVEYWSHGEQGTVIRVNNATFNNPDQPERFGPNDLGVEPGMRVAAIGRFVSLDPVWDGQRAVPRHEWEELVRKGEKESGPTVRRSLETANDGVDVPVEMLRKAYTLKGVVDMPLSAWRKYTERVIWAYELDDEQRQRAMLVLSDCETQARKTYTGRVEQFAALEERLKEAKRHITGDGADAIWEKLDSDVRAEIGFLTQIFNNELVPRLHRIPTRAQREAAIKKDRLPIQGL